MKLKRKFGLIIYLVPGIVLLILLLLEICYGKNELTAEKLTYSEQGDINYKVYLKENNYYDTPYLDENSSYIASLIDNFTINFSYINTFSDTVNYKARYNITADLEVYDSDNATKPIYKKEYSLLDDKEISGAGKMVKIDVLDQIIDYNKYNEIVQSLKQEIIPTANLIIKFNTKLDGKSNRIEKDINSNYTTTLNIPISQKTINIDLTKNNSKTNKTISNGKKLSFSYIIIVISTSLMLILSLGYYLLYVLKTKKKRSKYEQKVSKILREFDRAITEAKGELIIEEDATKIEVKDFEELLDVHDNLNVPIIYYRLNDNASIFLVRNNKDIYYNLIKSEDFE